MFPYPWRIALVWSRVCDASLVPCRSPRGPWFLYLHSCVTPVCLLLVTNSITLGPSLSVALTAQVMTFYAVSIFLRHVLQETYIDHLPAHTHDSVKHALLSTPLEESLFPRRSFSICWGKMGGFHCCNCCGLCRPRGVRKVRPPLLPLLLSDFVTLMVLNILLPPLRKALYIYLVVHRSTNCGFSFSSSSSFPESLL